MMMKNKKLWLVSFAMILLLSIGLGWWFYRSFSAVDRAYAEETNKEIAAMRNQAEVKSPERSAYLVSMASKLAAASDAMVMNVEFHGKVIDQFGNPVEGMKVTYDAAGSPYTSGSGIGAVITESDGSFIIANAKAYLLQIWELQKENYEARGRVSFRGFVQGGGDGIGSWADYTKDKPYIFHASKIEKYAKAFYGERVTWGFEWGQLYTLDLMDTINAGSKYNGNTAGDIRILFSVEDDDWKVKISAANGGLQETNDEYMNLAPDSGYFPEFEYSGKKIKQYRLNKQFYLQSRNGQSYSALKMEIVPYFNESQKESAIVMSYVVNLEGGRELAVKPEE